MATILFSTLSNGQTISFKPLVDVFRFDSASISAAPLQPQSDDFGSDFQATAAGKTIFFTPGFNASMELVIMTNDIAGAINTTNAAVAIG